MRNSGQPPETQPDPATMPAYGYSLRQTPDGRWLCEFPDIPFFHGVGKTEEEARNQAKAGLDAWLTRVIERQLTPPRPGSSRKASGQIRLRLPKQLQLRLTSYARATHTSLNELVNRMLSEGFPQFALTPLADKRQAFLAHLTALQEELSAVSLPALDVGVELRGEWLQRLGPARHQAVSVLAAQQQVSINRFIILVLTQEVSYRDALLASREFPALPVSADTTP